MPITNGRVHVKQHILQTRHRVGFVAGLCVAVAVVILGWFATVGNQIRSFFYDARVDFAAMSQTVSDARAHATTIAPPATQAPPNLIPALKAALEKQDTAIKE